MGVGGKVGYETTIDVNKVHQDGTALVNNGRKLVKQVDKLVTVIYRRSVLVATIGAIRIQPGTLNEDSTQRPIRSTTISGAQPMTLASPFRLQLVKRERQ